MRSVNDLEEMGKNSTDPASTAEDRVPEDRVPEDRVLVLLESISVHVKSLEGRFELMERRLDEIDPALRRVLAKAEPLSEPSSSPSFPPFALLCDGRVLLDVRVLEGIDLSGREMFTGILLSEAEANDAFERMANAFEEVAAHSAGWLRNQSKKHAGGKA